MLKISASRLLQTSLTKLGGGWRSKIPGYKHWGELGFDPKSGS